MNAPFSPASTPYQRVWRAWHGAFLDALFPPRCAGCSGWSREVFCSECAPRLKRVAAPFCAICSEPFDPLALAAAHCARCRAKPPAFLAARAVFEFHGPLREAIHRLKYRQKSALAPRLAPFLAQALQDDPVLCLFQPDCLVPVPLHRARLRKRGFNQSSLLSAELCALSGVPTRELLLRTRNTAPQVGLKGEARARNVHGAFAMRQAKIQLSGERVLLVDDVFTTGSTLHEAARVLLQAGASEVCALTLAR